MIRPSRLADRLDVTWIAPSHGGRMVWRPPADWWLSNASSPTDHTAASSWPRGSKWPRGPRRKRRGKGGRADLCAPCVHAGRRHALGEQLGLRDHPVLPGGDDRDGGWGRLSGHYDGQLVPPPIVARDLQRNNARLQQSAAGCPHPSPPPPPLHRPRPGRGPPRLDAAGAALRPDDRRRVRHGRRRARALRRRRPRRRRRRRLRVRRRSRSAGRG